MTIIAMNQLSKSYGQVQALNQIDLHVNEGDCVGFLGPNGAGKTTAIRIMLGLIKASGGETRVFGADAWKEAVNIHRRLAYVPGDVHLWPNLTGGEVIDVFGRLRGNVDSKRRAELIRRFDLDPTKKCGTYSKGNRQKVGLISAFASEVELYILDEPTSGLDPLMTQVFQECVEELKAEGKTILMSSHILSDVEKLCDDITIIRQGEIVETGKLSDLRHMTRLHMRVETASKTTGLEQIPGIYHVKREGLVTHFEVDYDAMDRALSQLITYQIRNLESRPPSLEDIFMQHYGVSSQAAAEGRGVI